MERIIRRAATDATLGKEIVVWSRSIAAKIVPIGKTQWLWYSAENSRWFFGREYIDGTLNRCSGTTVGGYIDASDPRWPYDYSQDGWYEYDGTGFVQNFNIGFDPVTEPPPNATHYFFVTGTLYQSNRHGLYNLIGNCNGEEM